jgi:hypothetical protein
MSDVRKQSKELDPYLKARIGEAYIQIRELAKPSNKPGTQKVYYTGNWVKDIHNNYTDKQAQKIFDNVAQYRDRLDFFQAKSDIVYEDIDGTSIQAYDYIARVK